MTEQTLLPIEEMVDVQVGVQVLLGYCRNIRVPVSMLDKLPGKIPEISAMLTGKFKKKGLAYECLGEIELVSEDLVGAVFHDMEGNPINPGR